jgi:uncharacterized coiled-coil DUF342 family protein
MQGWTEQHIDGGKGLASAKQALLGVEAGTKKAFVERNRIRSLLRDSFASIDIIAFPVPVRDLAQEEISKATLTDGYKDQLNAFRATVAVQLQMPKLFHGKPITCALLADLADVISKTMNDPDTQMLVPQSLFAQVEGQTVSRAKATFTKKLTDLKDKISANTEPQLKQADLVEEFKREVERLLEEACTELSVVTKKDEVLDEMRKEADGQQLTNLRLLLRARSASKLRRIAESQTAQLQAKVDALEKEKRRTLDEMDTSARARSGRGDGSHHRQPSLLQRKLNLTSDELEETKRQLAEALGDLECVHKELEEITEKLEEAKKKGTATDALKQKQSALLQRRNSLTSSMSTADLLSKTRQGSVIRDAPKPSAAAAATETKQKEKSGSFFSRKSHGKKKKK